MKVLFIILFTISSFLLVVGVLLTLGNIVKLGGVILGIGAIIGLGTKAIEGLFELHHKKRR